MGRLNGRLGLLKIVEEHHPSDNMSTPMLDADVLVAADSEGQQRALQVGYRLM
jgi:hypothetical protein